MRLFGPFIWRAVYSCEVIRAVHLEGSLHCPQSEVIRAMHLEGSLHCPQSEVIRAVHLKGSLHEVMWAGTLCVCVYTAECTLRTARKGTALAADAVGSTRQGQRLRRGGSGSTGQGQLSHRRRRVLGLRPSRP